MAEVAVHTSAQPVEDAARRVSEALQAVGPNARLGVAGGSALKALGLVRRQLPPALWATLRLTWVDERLVPFDDPRSNRGEAYRLGALSPQQPPANELPLVHDAESAQAAVTHALAGFTQGFGGALDVALLGMGEDGHVASLFPGHPALAQPGPVLAIGDSPKPPPQRVTLALPVLARPGLTRVLLATGAEKRAALEGLLRGEQALPVARLGPLALCTDQQLGA